jgi:DMSO/TMAO reductase YedYZ molybdopterin-dependent catalytic subunit
VKSIAFVAEDQPGYWERLGYHDRGDPWVQNEQHPDGERFRGAPTAARLRGELHH